MSASPWIVSLATGAGRFAEGLTRLRRSLEAADYRGEMDFWPPDRAPEGCPSHLGTPFAFKPFCLQDAARRGARTVLWLDSSCVVVRSLDPLLRKIEAEGYLLFRNGRFKVGEWASDLALDVLRVSRAEAMALPEVNAAAIGLRLDHGRGREFLDRWLDEAKRGTAFRGLEAPLVDADDYADVKWNRGGRISTDPRVRGHRHDQTVAGVLAHRLGLELESAGLRRYHEGARVDRETRIVVDRDLRLSARGIEDARRAPSWRASWKRALRYARRVRRRLAETVGQ